MRRKSGNAGLRTECRDCTRAYNKRYFEANREKLLAQCKEYAQKNSDAVRKRASASHARKMRERPDEVRARRRAYHQRTGKAKFKAWFKERVKNDPKFRIRINLGSRFRQFFKNKPQGGFQSIVGYTVSDLYDHLERQFDETMTWENYGTVWEIDHKRPVSSFDLPDEAAACWALSNLRPLASTLNRRKSNKILPEFME